MRTASGAVGWATINKWFAPDVTMPINDLASDTACSDTHGIMVTYELWVSRLLNCIEIEAEPFLDAD
jgi:hypothetical protein